jgi:hypothetical protein
MKNAHLTSHQLRRCLCCQAVIACGDSATHYQTCDNKCQRSKIEGDSPKDIALESIAKGLVPANDIEKEGIVYEPPKRSESTDTTTAEQEVDELLPHGRPSGVRIELLVKWVDGLEAPVPAVTISLFFTAIYATLLRPGSRSLAGVAPML